MRNRAFIDSCCLRSLACPHGREFVAETDGLLGKVVTCEPKQGADSILLVMGSSWSGVGVACRCLAGKAGLVTLADKGYQGSTWAKAPRCLPGALLCRVEPCMVGRDGEVSPDGDRAVVLDPELDLVALADPQCTSDLFWQREL
jgi:hypothetical protein